MGRDGGGTNTELRRKASGRSPFKCSSLVLENAFSFLFP